MPNEHKRQTFLGLKHVLDNCTIQAVKYYQTIVPHPATLLLNAQSKENIRESAKRNLRDISLITTKNFRRKKSLEYLHNSIMEEIPAAMINAARKNITAIS